jgi:site-specific DNA-methyltransferase (adenine-specific)
LTASQPFTSALVMSNIKMFKYEWIWEKEQGVGFQLAKYRPLIKNESCLVFSIRTPKYNPQKELLNKPIIIKRKANSNGKSETSPIKYSDERISIYTHKTPDNFLKFNRDRGLHPTQKPVALFEYLIKTYTNEGDLVLDNCAGSFTTAIASENLKRNWICIEKEAEYCAIGEKRIKENRERLHNIDIIKKRLL